MIDTRHGCGSYKTEEPEETKPAKELSQVDDELLAAIHHAVMREIVRREDAAKKIRRIQSWDEMRKVLGF